MNAANTVNRAHDELIHVSVNQKVSLLAEEHFDDRPDDLADLFRNLHLLAQLVQRLSGNVQHSRKEYVVGS